MEPIIVLEMQLDKTKDHNAYWRFFRPTLPTEQYRSFPLRVSEWENLGSPVVIEVRIQGVEG